MQKLLHQNFLQSMDEYVECRRYWRALLLDVQATTCTYGQWHEWIADFHPGGKPFELREFELDGSAIANARSYATNRAIRVNQHLFDESYGVYLHARVADYRTGYPSTWPTAELIVDLVLSEHTASITRRLIERWMWPEVTLEQMISLIDSETAA